MEVAEGAVRKMFVAGGFKMAAESSLKRLQTYVDSVPTRLDDMKDLEGEDKFLFLSIAEAIEKGEEVTVVEEETEEEEVEEKPKKKKPAKAKEKEEKPKAEKSAKAKHFEGAAGEGRPGIIASIRDFLLQAGKDEEPVTKKEVHEMLVEKFGPGTDADRDPDSMMKTTTAQLSYHLKAKGYEVCKEKVKRDDKEVDGYWMETEDRGPTQKGPTGAKRGRPKKDSEEEEGPSEEELAKLEENGEDVEEDEEVKEKPKKKKAAKSKK